MTENNSVQITVNGETLSVSAALTVVDLLVARGLLGKRIAVEVNGQIVPKSRHATTPVQQGDHIEIVNAVGGG